ncbi:MAG: STAS domain-containing protein [Candidatus Eremiobacteraeota bacterium]|nr:STAS domain-containing protein [Candidatus Eremiobacteraeota bacterium]
MVYESPVDSNNGATFVYSTGEPVVVLAVYGELDLANKDQFHDAILRAANVDGEVAVDLTHCAYLDSTAIGAMISCHKQLSHLSIRLAGNPIVERLFRIARLHEALHCDIA